MTNDLDAVTIPAHTDALKALEKMRRQGISRLLVTQDDHLAGILSLKDLLAFLKLKLAAVTELCCKTLLMDVSA